MTENVRIAGETASQIRNTFGVRPLRKWDYSVFKDLEAGMNYLCMSS